VTTAEAYIFVLYEEKKIMESLSYTQICAFPMTVTTSRYYFPSWN